MRDTAAINQGQEVTKGGRFASWWLVGGGWRRFFLGGIFVIGDSHII
jgi:hypothetical protein